MASANGQDGVVSLLIERGANIEHADSSGWTALHQVIFEQQTNKQTNKEKKKKKTNKHKHTILSTLNPAVRQCFIGWKQKDKEKTNGQYQNKSR